jgi:hypothetical protein
MKTSIRWIVVALSFSLAPGAWLKQAAAVTDEEFRALQQQMQQQAEEIKDLKKGRAEDQQEIQQLKEKVGATEQKATETQKKAEEAQKTATEAAAKVQPVGPVPNEEAAATRNLVISGFADVQYQKNEGERGSFFLAHFNPVLLFRASDKVLAEAEMEMEVTPEGGTEMNLEYAQIDYLFNDYVTFIAGRFTLPIGVVREKLDAMWINKLPIQPLPEADTTAIIPENDIGVQARGGLHICDPVVLTYAVYLVNGPGDDDAGNVVFNNGADFNKNPSGGGRLAVFYPWEAYHDIEVGVSGQTGAWSNDGELLWSALAVDGALHLTQYAEFRGEYIKTWQETAGGPTLDRDGWWAQVAYKLAGLNLELPMVNNLEAVFRYSGVSLPTGHANQYALGLIYHVTNTLLVKGAYVFGQSNTVDADGNSLDRNQLTLQFVYGF